MSKVLVTGGSGFVAIHVIDQLLNSGHEVRTTVRSAAKQQVVLDMLHQAGNTHVDRLSFAIADLVQDAGWNAACAGCEYVLHVASPMFATKNPDDMMKPAIDGVLRVLRAARDAGVRRVVYTSTCGAIYYGHPPQTTSFDETYWTNTDSAAMSLYVRSKALAERAAWDFMAREGGSMEFTTVNPAGIFGPALGPDYSESLTLIKQLVEGSMPAVPDLWLCIVDVRDVADLHLRAMTAPEAAGQRFIASEGDSHSLREVARVLRERLGMHGAKIPTRALPTFIVRIMARFNQQLADLAPLLGNRRNATGAKAMRMLGWKPRAWQDAVTDTAKSLLQLGIVK